MKKPSISRLLALLAALPLATLPGAAAAPASPEPATKSAMLQSIAKEVIVPAYEELAARSRKLTNAVGELAKEPGQKSLDRAREAWCGTLLAASRVRCFQVGPLRDRDYGATFF